MATSCLLRSLQGAAIGRTLMRPLIQRTSPALFTQSRAIQSSSTHAAREYGPPSEFVSKTSHWKMERIVAVALIPIIPGALVYPNVATDMLLCTAMVLHSHWGLCGVISDYIHGPVLPKLLSGAVLVLSVLAFGSLCYLNLYDIGFANAARMIYSQL